MAERGRPKGGESRNTRRLKSQLKQLLGEDFNPVVKMAEMAVRLNDTAIASGDPSDQKSSVDAWDKVANYIEPKLKAVEVKGEIDNRILVRTIDLSGKKEETADTDADS